MFIFCHIRLGELERKCGRVAYRASKVWLDDVKPVVVS